MGSEPHVRQTAGRAGHPVPLSEERARHRLVARAGGLPFRGLLRVAARWLVVLALILAGYGAAHVVGSAVQPAAERASRPAM